MRTYFNVLDGSTYNFDRLFSEFFAPQTSPEAPKTVTQAAAYDVDETEAHYRLSFDMPGVARDSIKIELKGDQLVVEGERKTERLAGRFYRALTLAKAVEAKRVEAVYKDGVLRVAIPKAEAEKPHQIKVSEEDTSGVFKTLLANENPTPKSLN